MNMVIPLWCQMLNLAKLFVHYQSLLLSNEHISCKQSYQHIASIGYISTFWRTSGDKLTLSSCNILYTTLRTSLELRHCSSTFPARKIIDEHKIVLLSVKISAKPLKSKYLCMNTAAADAVCCRNNNHIQPKKIQNLQKGVQVFETHRILLLLERNVIELQILLSSYWKFDNKLKNALIFLIFLKTYRVCAFAVRRCQNICFKISGISVFVCALQIGLN